MQSPSSNVGNFMGGMDLVGDRISDRTPFSTGSARGVLLPPRVKAPLRCIFRHAPSECYWQGIWYMQSPSSIVGNFVGGMDLVGDRSSDRTPLSTGSARGVLLPPRV